MRFLMCKPEYYGIEYEINPWMNIKYKPDHTLALKQWETLYQLISNTGAEIALVPQIKGLPDMTFTANAGLYAHDCVLLSHFKYKERQGETKHYQEWFNTNQLTVIETHGLPYFEGAGDALFAGELLFAGYGFRTEKKFYENCKFFDKTKLVYCELQDPYYYHIDTCFCPITDSLAIWFPSAFTESTQMRMKENIELIDVTGIEAQQFACNAVVIDKHIILPAGCPTLTNALEKRGFIVHACDMSEYKKAGGACKCLTMRID